MIMVDCGIELGAKAGCLNNIFSLFQVLLKSLYYHNLNKPSVIFYVYV
jgi:hypothetical protein